MVNYSDIAEIKVPEIREVYSSTDTVTKDKILTVRVEEGLWNLLEAYSEKMNTGSVAKTARAILSMFLLPQVYKYELESMKPEKLSEVVRNKKEPVTLDRYKRFIEELEKYSSFLAEAEEKSKVSIQFIEQEKQKVEKTVSMLKKVQTKWKELLFEENEENVK